GSESGAAARCDAAPLVWNVLARLLLGDRQRLVQQGNDDVGLARAELLRELIDRGERIDRHLDIHKARGSRGACLQICESQFLALYSHHIPSSLYVGLVNAAPTLRHRTPAFLSMVEIIVQCTIAWRVRKIQLMPTAGARSCADTTTCLL